MTEQIVRLVLRDGDGRKRSFKLPRSGVIGLGSSSKCQVRIDSEDFAPIHCVIRCAPGGYDLLVKDTERGARVNGRPVQKSRLRDGDSVQIGATELRFRIESLDPFVGKKVGGYRIEEFVGKGGAGTVYRATQLSLNRTVAVKILSPKMTRDRDFVLRFLKEARAIARLNHPNVVQIYDVVQEGKFFLFSMEYLPGGTLGDLLKREGRLTCELATEMACDVAKALTWAEEKNIVHRDIKPDNLLLAQNGRVKLADLGLAVEALDSGANRKRTWAGSPRFMAPEQAETQAVDHRADIYALGCTLYRAVTGGYLFDGKSAAEILRKKMNSDPPPIEKNFPDLPKSFSRVVNRMVARNPAERYGSCRRMLEELEQLRRTLGMPRDVEYDEGIAGSSGTGQRRRATATIRPLTAALVLIALFIASFFGTRNVYTNYFTPDRAESTEKLSGPDADGDSGTRPGTEPSQRNSGEAEKREPQYSPGFSRLNSILSEHERRNISGRQAVARLERIKAKHNDAALDAAVDGHIERIRSELALRQAPDVHAALRENFDGYIDTKSLREAHYFLQKLEKRYPENTSLLEEPRKQLAETAEATWEEDLAKSNELYAQSDFAGSIEHLERTKLRLPPGFEARIAERIAASRDGNEALTRFMATREKLEKDISRHLSELNFAEAAAFEKGLQSLPDIAQIHSLAEAFSARARTEIELMQSTFGTLITAVDRAIKRGKSLEVIEDHALAGDGTELRIKERSGTILSVNRRVKGERPQVSLFDLSTTQLLSLVKDAKLSPASGLMQREGLGLLLFHQGRILRARELLLDEELPAERRKLYTPRLASAENDYMARRLSFLKTRLAKAVSLTPGQEKTVQTWFSLSQQITRMIEKTAHLDGFSDISDEIRKIYVRVKHEALRIHVPDNLFRGTVKSHGPKPSDPIELLYVFSSNEELLDFRLVGSRAGQLQLRQGAMQIKGEYRFLGGNPFQGQVTVSGVIPTGGYSRRAPNINLALWTHESDQVTPKATSKVEKTDVSKVVPDDYFVFGMGFALSADSDDYDTRFVEIPGIDKVVSTPAIVLLGGVRGLPIGTFKTREGIWGKSLDRKLKGKVEFELRSGTDRVYWSLNRRPQIFKKSRFADRLRRAEPYVGSFTLFTNDEVVSYDTLEITATLNPTWVEEKLERLARTELKKLEASLSRK